MIYEEKTVCDLEQVKSLMFQHVDTFPLHFEAYFIIVLNMIMLYVKYRN